MKVCVMGLGYIGLPTACIVAHAGHHVLGVDVNRVLVDQLNNGDVPIVNEPGLRELVVTEMRAGQLRVASVPEPADVFVIAVPTPVKRKHYEGTENLEFDQMSYKADLSYVESALGAVAPFLREGSLLILESTVPPGTTETVLPELLKCHSIDPSTVLLAHAPERVLPGNIMYELVHNDRIVGGVTPEATDAARTYYQSFVQGQVAVTDATTAELVKLMENTFRDVNIALANEFALVAEHLGVSVWKAIDLANLHPRVRFLRPGPGVGGHCIAVDPYFVIEAAPHITRLIQAARTVNRYMPLHVLQRFDEFTVGVPIQKVAILGASYKADVGDERESPALEIAHLLTNRGLQVVVHDPYVEKFGGPLKDKLADADVVLLLTDHKVYRGIDPTEVAEVVRRPLLLDARGHLDADQWHEAGFEVMQLGASRTLRAAVKSSGGL